MLRNIEWIDHEAKEEPHLTFKRHTAWKLSKYGVISGSYFPAFELNTRDTPYVSVVSPNAGKYGSEKTPYLDTFHAVTCATNDYSLERTIMHFVSVTVKNNILYIRNGTSNTINKKSQEQFVF